MNVTHRYSELAFTPRVRALQEQAGSREHYAAVSAGSAGDDRLTEREAEFIRARDSFYLASVNENGWPYVQHRGGPAGFMKVIDDATLGFADYRGNRQYLSAGNLLGNDRVALFFMDYPNRRRLKLLGRARQFGPEEQAARLDLADAGYEVRAERSMIIDVVAFDWNCPQHITPRYSLRELETLGLVPDPAGR